MKFSLVDDYTYFWPVTVARPDQDKAGAWIEEEFEMEFAAIDQDEADALEREFAELPAEQRPARQYDLIKRVARGWRGVVDAGSGEEIPFSPEHLVKMLKMGAWYRNGILKSYYSSIVRDEARKGN